jgi:hypothetical protein
MNIFQLLQNPFIKIIGIAAVLYFGLLYKNDDPESLKTRLDPNRIQGEIDEVKQQGHFILTNLNEAKNPQNLQAPRAQAQARVPEISANDLILGNSQETVKCGDEVFLDYKIYDLKGRLIDEKNDVTLIAINALENLIAKYLVGARKGGIREIFVPYDLETTNEEIINYREKAASSFKYQVTIKNINSATSAQNCPENEKK